MPIDKSYIITFLKSNRNYLLNNFSVNEISLFGSYARGEETEESDIDFYVKMPPSYNKMCELIDFLEKSFQKKVDVIRRQPHIRESFKSEIEKDMINV